MTIAAVETINRFAMQRAVKIQNDFQGLPPGGGCSQEDVGDDKLPTESSDSQAACRSQLEVVYHSESKDY